MLIFFLFLQTKPSFSCLFAWSQLDISATSGSVSVVSEGYQLNYCWILKLLRGPRIFKLINLCDNQLNSIPYSFLCLCSFWFWGKYSYSWMWNDISRNCLKGHRKKKAKFLMRTFTCRSTFLYVAGRFNIAGQSLLVKTALRTERVYGHHRGPFGVNHQIQL